MIQRSTLRTQRRDSTAIDGRVGRVVGQDGALSGASDLWDFVDLKRLITDTYPYLFRQCNATVATMSDSSAYARDMRFSSERRVRTASRQLDWGRLVGEC